MSPLFFEPILKRTRWGGRRLGSVLGKRIGGESDYAESWEIADHGDDQSIALIGEHSGEALATLVRDKNQELFGANAGLTQFPLLIKFLDANDWLSLQVHPNDEQARTYDVTENGKTEAWVIIDADPGSEICVGLKPGVSKSDFAAHLEAGTIEETLHKFEVRSGDCVFVPAGTVHAIGSGVLLAEVQQQSDLTFRLHDWGRMGSDGKPRELHIEQSLACIDFERGPVRPVEPTIVSGGSRRLEKATGTQPMSPNRPTSEQLPRASPLFQQPASHRHEELVRDAYFVIHRHTADSTVEVRTENQFRIVMLLSGSATATWSDGAHTLSAGSTMLVSASLTSVAIEPQPTATFLEVFLPPPA